MAANFLCQLAGFLAARAKRDVRNSIGQPAGVRRAHYRGFRHVGMAEERILHFDRRNPHARDLQHVVGAAAVAIITVGIAQKLIAGDDPAAPFRASGKFRNPPILRERAGAAHPKVADLAHGGLGARVINNLCVIARYWKAAASRFALARPAGDEHVQHLGRANPVQNFQASRSFPTVENLCRQGFASGNALANRGEIEAMACGFRLSKKGGIKSGNGEENRRPMLGNHFDDARGSGAFGI